MWTNQLELNDVAHGIGEEVRFNGRFYSNFKSFDEAHSDAGHRGCIAK